MGIQSTDVLEHLIATAEVCGTVLSPAAARLMVADLSPFEPEQVIGGLRRCRREVKGKLTLADILNRIDDGRPGPEEAFAMIPPPEDEDSTCVMTREMALAMESARHLGDPIARRMAFREAYVRLVQQARERSESARWSVSLGHDSGSRAEVVADAVAKGRIGRYYAERLVGLPSLQRAEAIARGESTAITKATP